MPPYVTITEHASVMGWDRVGDSMLAKFAVSAALVISLAAAGAVGAADAAAVPRPATSTEYGVSAARLACSPTSGKKLESRGGPVAAGAFVNIIYWGSWWQSHGGTAKSELRELYSALGGSSWATTLTQYCGRYGRASWPSDLLGVKPRIVKAKPPAKPTEKQFGQLIARYAPPPEEGVPGIDVIVTPPGSVPAYDAPRKACGHHAWSAITLPDKTTIDEPWIDIPFGIIEKTGGCGWKLKQGVSGALSVVAGHEWAEAVTDPYPNSKVNDGLGTGWVDPRIHPAQEVADICLPDVRFHFLHRNSFVLKLKTGKFVMQKLWSNKAGKCVGE